MDVDKIYEFFLQWEIAFRTGSCMPLEEYQAMSPEDVAVLNTEAFQAFMEAENPL